MTKTKTLFRQLSYGLVTLVLVFAYLQNTASAAPIMNRTLVIGSSVASASTTYNFNFAVPSSTVIQSVGFAACTTASGACTPAPGFSSASSTLTSQPTNLGDASGWAVNTSTSSQLRLSKSGNAAAPTGSQTVSFSGVINPSSTNSTFFMRITTYSDAAWSTPIDTGTVASSTAGQVTVTVGIDEMLTFTLANSAVTLSAPTTSSTGTGTSSMTVSTNAASGYSVSYNGSTLTSGSNTITAMAAAAASTTNTKQFGMNLMSNTTPAVGTNVSGSGVGAATTGYNTTNLFKFSTSGDVVASAAAPTNDNTFTSSYIVNMNGETAAGSYSTILTYIATANF